MNEWIRFWITAVVLVIGLGFLTAGVIGNCRFRYVMNRIHAAGVGDTLGLLFVTIALAVSTDGILSIGKLFLPLVFLWITSPISGHFLGQIEYFTNPKLYEHMSRKGGR